MEKLVPRCWKIADKAVDEKAWLEARRKLVTASDVAAILGWNPYCSARDVFIRKMTGEEQPINVHMQRGVDREAGILERFSKGPYRRITGLYQSIAYPWLGASFDGVVRRWTGRCALVEVKAPKSLTDVRHRPKEYHVVQLLAQLIVCPMKYGYLVYGNTRETVDYIYSLDDGSLCRDIVDITKRFHDCLQTGVLTPEFW